MMFSKRAMVNRPVVHLRCENGASVNSSTDQWKEPVETHPSLHVRVNLPHGLDPTLPAKYNVGSRQRKTGNTSNSQGRHETQKPQEGCNRSAAGSRHKPPWPHYLFIPANRQPRPPLSASLAEPWPASQPPVAHWHSRPSGVEADTRKPPRSIDRLLDLPHLPVIVFRLGTGRASGRVGPVVPSPHLVVVVAAFLANARLLSAFPFCSPFTLPHCTW